MHIGKPLGVVYLADELSCQKPSQLFTNCLPLLHGGPTEMLFLGDHDNIGKPLGVVYLADELSSQKPSHLLANCLPLLHRGPTECSLTGFAFGSTRKRCSASPLGTPDMSEAFHAKMSQFSRRN